MKSLLVYVWIALSMGCWTKDMKIGATYVQMGNWKWVEVAGREVQIWSMDSGKLEGSIHVDSDVSCIKVDPVVNRLFVSTLAGTIYVWTHQHLHTVHAHKPILAVDWALEQTSPYVITDTGSILEIHSLHAETFQLQPLHALPHQDQILDACMIQNKVAVQYSNSTAQVYSLSMKWIEQYASISTDSSYNYLYILNQNHHTITEYDDQLQVKNTNTFPEHIEQVKVEQYGILLTSSSNELIILNRDLDILEKIKSNNLQELLPSIIHAQHERILQNDSNDTNSTGLEPMSGYNTSFLIAVGICIGVVLLIFVGSIIVYCLERRQNQYENTANTDNRLENPI